MKKLNIVIVLAMISLTFFSCKNEEKKTEETPVEVVTTQKIVSLNGALTEIVSALGHEKEIVGVDVTSTYPESIKKTAQDLGHVRSLSIEAIMALQPTVIFATDKDLNPELLEKIKKSGVQAHIFTQEFTKEGTKKLVEEAATVLKNTDFKKLQTTIDEQLAQVKPIAKAPKVLFIYARGAGTLMVAGTNTPVEKIIALAGGQNAITEFEDFKPLTPESLLKGNPDVILLFTTGLQSLGGIDGVLKIQGIDKTNAGKNKKIIAMDGQLLSGFGPRLGEATLQLNSLLIENAK
ncbi:heme/hemin ABC transporter substrate-binding protein [Flavobacterium sp. '19STA2R22 D10 B1']|uniref:heme/hemin ABC transporter substrate-binding protein n=1 Tax=Flavobacterium aerium TaxID=3037261 RepID=UPI00278C0388|nr:ABC transporter substrate-binding protein [Flavobacterium sp. '19STA2R22 D10 B1']